MKMAMIFGIGLVGVAQGAIVDRIAVTVGDKIVTDSEISLRIRLSAFQNDRKAEFDPAARREAAHELVDQRLVEREMDVGHYPRLVDAARKALLDQYAKTNYKSDPAAMAKALAAYKLTPQELEDDLGKQADLLTFLNLRIRPAVQANDKDPKLNDQRTTNEMNLWLQDQYKRTKIEYLEKDLESR